ncbi:MAG: hypothetical protein ACMUEL_01040 [Flavobacteriales bacterium Tduv]
MNRKIKKFGSILRSTAQLNFSELYMDPSTRSRKFFKRLKILNPTGKGWRKK